MNSHILNYHILHLTKHLKICRLTDWVFDGEKETYDIKVHISEEVNLNEKKIH